MPQILAVGGGKGGSGKSFIAANLGVELAKQDRNVFLVDLDLGTPNLHTMLGLDSPKAGLHNFLNGSTKDLSFSAVPTEVPGLHLISSSRCSSEIDNLYYAQKRKIIRAVTGLPADLVVMDLGAGTAYDTLDFFLSADEGLCVLTPEPTSIQNSVQFINAVYLRKLKHLLKRDVFTRIIKDMGDGLHDGPSSAPLDMVERIIQQEPDRSQLLRQELRRIEFCLILNQYRKQVDKTLGNKMEKVCNRHFYSHFNFLGNIFYNDRVFESIIAKKIFSLKYPYTATSTDLKAISRTLMASDTQSSSPDKIHAQV